jgi:hypothetical protein
MVRYRSTLRSSAVAAAPVRFRMWLAALVDQLEMTKRERSSPPKASSHQILA